MSASLLSGWERTDHPLAQLSSSQRHNLNMMTRLTSDTNNSSSSSNVLNVVDEASATASQTTTTEDTNCWDQPRKVENGRHFLDWLDNVETMLRKSNDAHFRRCSLELGKAFETTQSLLDKVHNGLDVLASLGHQYVSASTKSNNLHEVCQHLMADRSNLAAISNQIRLRLNYFSEADRLQLNTSSVLNESFFKGLDTIDTCSTYMRQNGQFRESRAYLVKYQAALSKALASVRSHVRSVIELCTVNTMTQGSSSFNNLYGKFRSQAQRVNPIIDHLNNRSEDCPLISDYESCVQDCQAVYINARQQIMLPSFESAVGDLKKQHERDHCGLVRACGTLLLRVCQDEADLHRQFFTINGEQFNEYLDGICSKLYDVLRPLIIHLHHLETLSELTTILRSEMLEQHCTAPQNTIRPFETVILQLLQDVQERLVYRAHIYIRSDILGFVPHEGDLLYPEKLEMMASIAEKEMTSKPPERKYSTSSATSMEVELINHANEKAQVTGSPADMHGMWYPTVRRTLMCLSKLYRCLEKEIFQGLSQEALSACVTSVEHAASFITKRKSFVHGQLFFIKHLLILREQVAPFHVELSIMEKSLDFSKLKTAALSLLAKKMDILSLNSNNALLEYVVNGTTPDVKEKYIDSRKEVDKKLKVICEEFIQNCSDLIVADINKALTKAKMNSAQPNNNGTTANDLQDVVSRCKQNLKKVFPTVQHDMHLYLANKETEFILFRPIRNNVMTAFLMLQQHVCQKYSADEQVIVGCPSQEQIAVMMTSLQMHHVAHQPVQETV